MEVNFICDGIIIRRCAMHYVPDLDDRIKINEGFYYVRDGIFNMTNRVPKVDIILEEIGRK